MRKGLHRALLALLVLSSLAVACGQDSAADDDDGTTQTPTPTPTNTNAPAPPVTGAMLPDLALSDGWTNPRRLADDVNTSGWEDSSFISPDGTTLYFGYSRGNITLLVNSGMQVADGPDRPGHHANGFDVYEATIDGNAWMVTNSSVNDPGDTEEAAQGVDAARSRMAFIRFELTPQYDPNIYFAEWSGTAWTNVQKAPAPLSTGCAEDNPTLSADGLRLYWDSDRADASGTSCLPPNGSQERFLWTSAWDGANWSTPVQVEGQDFVTPIVHWQPYEDFAGENLYWSGATVACPFGCLYKAPITGPGAVGPATTIMQITTSGNGHLWAIGEMSITADGHYLYFTYGVKDPSGTIDVSIGVAER
jgi:hypothetical protein